MGRDLVSKNVPMPKVPPILLSCPTVYIYVFIRQANLYMKQFIEVRKHVTLEHAMEHIHMV